ncbi:uncharacterized protein MYCFIDRAFT_161338 [Pseudocercospora fijiensis CIRAD86]|uniref:CENP-V/GFA domain-containing protein n=1 Tax=Pseudocercospora fijiensis (strain CIRAD86) TaxID=383855 RepID=M3AM89_PSEFD|nr:uncharacterized protein MYCFIDRAFT_161338 [Pseudocercospora fijiensis CIRAD86]EME85696.1 hypothetical protein MYCFIDRAFT_161338 [Pseudocercospora fijiensis CIRAD86]
MATTTPQNTYKGSCLCGSISIVLTLDKDLYSEPNGHLCHCLNCRKFSGGPAAMCFITPTKTVQLTDSKKTLKVYQDSNTGSGRTVPRSFCSACGSPVGCVPTLMDERVSIVTLGLFDKVPAPCFECYTSQRLPWSPPAADAERQYQFIDEVINHVPSLE